MWNDPCTSEMDAEMKKSCDCDRMTQKLETPLLSLHFLIFPVSLRFCLDHSRPTGNILGIGIEKLYKTSSKEPFYIFY